MRWRCQGKREQGKRREEEEEEEWRGSPYPGQPRAQITNRKRLAAQ